MTDEEQQPNPTDDPDAYYGDDAEAAGEDLDLSFLDEDDGEDEAASKE